jgi:hypothetical protein
LDADERRLGLSCGVRGRPDRLTPYGDLGENLSGVGSRVKTGWRLPIDQLVKFVARMPCCAPSITGEKEQQIGSVM